MGYTTITREHEISCGHRVFGHEGGCKHCHGHNYLFRMTVAANELDSIGRVIDFGEIKRLLCGWLENNWDHKFIVWENDPMSMVLRQYDPHGVYVAEFNPTVENMASYFAESAAPSVLKSTGVVLVSVQIWETAKCSATYSIEKDHDDTVRTGQENAIKEERKSEVLEEI